MGIIDQPLKEGSTDNQDLLNVDDYAVVLANFIAYTDTPMTIGVHTVENKTINEDAVDREKWIEQVEKGNY